MAFKNRKVCIQQDQHASPRPASVQYIEYRYSIRHASDGPQSHIASHIWTTRETASDAQSNFGWDDMCPDGFEDCERIGFEG